MTRTRNLLFDRGYIEEYKSVLPVISVGNMTVGGNGKTPLVAFVVNCLKEAGFSPCVVMRGYGGSEVGPYLVRAKDSPAKVGDEALLLEYQLKIPVVVSRKRKSGLKLVETDSLGDVVVLDDGLQHRYVARDLDVVTHYIGGADEERAFARGRLLPWGRFRESRSNALRRIACIVFASRSMQRIEVPRHVRALLPQHVDVYHSYLEVDGLFLDGRKVVESEFTGDWVAICAIANPEGFWATLERYGLNVVKKRSFSDHKILSNEQIKELEREFPDARFVCTAKDMVKLRHMISNRWYELRVRNLVEPAREFKDSILESVNCTELERRGKSENSCN